MPPRKPGPTEAAVLADIEHYELERFPTARSLAASAQVLARRLDAEPNAAVARELRLILDALARVTAEQADDGMRALLEQLSTPSTGDLSTP